MYRTDSPSNVPLRFAINGHQHNERAHARCRDLHWFLSVKVEINWDSNSNQEMKSLCHLEMDGDQHCFSSLTFTISIQWPQ